MITGDLERALNALRLIQKTKLPVQHYDGGGARVDGEALRNANRVLTAIECVERALENTIEVRKRIEAILG